MIKNIKQYIAFASGKGGVGKSTCSFNTAITLKTKGYKVGILDADIFGPSLTQISGISEKAELKMTDQQKIIPFEINGLKMMSSSFFNDKEEPLAFRGPIVSNILQQMLFHTLWGDLDYLIIDLPPGTGDVHLTISQKLQLNSAIIITTPQDLALIDVIKSINMFKKLNINIIGVIENMSTFICPKCNKETRLFGKDSEIKLAKFGVKNIAKIPLNLDLRISCDTGENLIEKNRDHHVSKKFLQVANEIELNTIDKQTTKIKFS